MKRTRKSVFCFLRSMRNYIYFTLVIVVNKPNKIICMIASLSLQPDIKAYLKEVDVEELWKGNQIEGSIYLYTKEIPGRLLLRIDAAIRGSAQRCYDNLGEHDVSVALSPELFDEFKQIGFIWGERMVASAQKLTLIIKGRLDKLDIPRDVKDSLEWSYDVLERKLSPGKQSV